MGEIVDCRQVTKEKQEALGGEEYKVESLLTLAPPPQVWVHRIGVNVMHTSS